jgi:polyisoprenoid-binding protein YceI
MSTWTLLAVLLAAGAQPVDGADGQKLAEGEINVKSSRVYIYVGKVGLGHEHAVVGELKSGSLHLGANSEAGDIVFDMTTFAADTAEARKYLGLKGTTSASMQKDVSANMLGSDVLNVRKFPTATLTISSALPLKKQSKNGHPQYRLEGDFTLHGVKRPLKFNAEAIEEGDGIRVRGSFAIRQTDFGIQPYAKAFGAVGVTDELSIYGEMHLAKPPAAAGRSRDRK